MWKESYQTDPKPVLCLKHKSYSDVLTPEPEPRLSDLPPWGQCVSQLLTQGWINTNLDTWIYIEQSVDWPSALPLLSCVAMDKLLTLSELHFLICAFYPSFTAAPVALLVCPVFPVP